MIIYTICLVGGLLFTVFSVVAGHFFGHDGHTELGGGGHAEAGFDHSDMPGMSIFSPTVLATFMTSFGAFGMIFSKIDATRSAWISAPLAGVCALGIAAVIFWLFSLIYAKTQGSSEGRVASLVGQIASIITPIPDHGVGEISYTQGGSRYTAPARSERGAAIAAGESVCITRIVGTQYYVESIM